MPRLPRAIAVGYPHHITQRGNHREAVFTEPGDYSRYLKWLAQYAEKYGFDVWRIEGILGRTFATRPRGRPRKNSGSAVEEEPL